MKSESNAPAIIAYLTIIGWIVAFFVGDRKDYYTAHHLNQSLVIYIIGALSQILTKIPLIGGWARLIVSVFMFICWCMGIFRAATSSTEPLPIIGDIHIIG